MEVSFHENITYARIFYSGIYVKRKFNPATINFDATAWEYMVPASLTIEPATTKGLSVKYLEECLLTSSAPLIPDLTCHTQSVERCVKMVSEARLLVYGREKRHLYVLTKQLSRRERPRFLSKRSYRYVSHRI